MILNPDEFLRAHPDSWIARRAPEFPVINVHALEVAAPTDRVFTALADPSNLSPAWYWQVLFAVRGLAGKLFRWDPGVKWHRPEPLVPGNHYTFFLIEHVAAPGREAQSPVAPPCELGVSVENRLTLALMSYLIVPNGAGSRVYNVTCALFKGRTGRAYWRLIRPFHDALIEDMLKSLCARAEHAGHSML
jgi:hypothetical protein